MYFPMIATSKGTREEVGYFIAYQDEVSNFVLSLTQFQTISLQSMLVKDCV